MLKTPANLLLIGFEQDKENLNLYTRHDGQYDFGRGAASVYAGLLSSELSEEESDARSKKYLEWDAQIEKEIKEKLNLK